jgi:predicted dehydrogenase
MRHKPEETRPMADLIRIALIGAGAFGRKHISVLQAVPGFALAGIADPSPAAEALAAQHGVPWFTDAGALLDAVRPDGAIVVTPNHLHLPHGLLCIEHGVPAIIEKPVAETPEGGEQLAAAAEEADVPIMVGHHRRHNPLLEAARDVVASGRLGRVVAVNLTWLLRKPESYFDVAWRREPGGGPIMINLVHEIDALRFVVGDIVSVRAMTSNAMRGFPVEDTVAITVRFANGALGSVIVSDVAESPWSWELTSGENPMYPQQPGGNGMIAGTEGSLSLPHLDLWRHVEEPGVERGWTAPMQRARVPVTMDDAYHRQLRHFGRVIRREEAPRVTARDAARSFAVCLAVYESARTGQEVAV